MDDCDKPKDPRRVAAENENDGVSAALIELRNRLLAEPEEDESLLEAVEELLGGYKRQALREENERLRKENERLCEENGRLRNGLIVAATILTGMGGIAALQDLGPTLWKKLNQWLDAWGQEADPRREKVSSAVE